jgi:hypothetical protein
MIFLSALIGILQIDLQTQKQVDGWAMMARVIGMLSTQYERLKGADFLFLWLCCI